MSHEQLEEISFEVCCEIDQWARSNYPGRFELLRGYAWSCDEGNHILRFDIFPEPNRPFYSRTIIFHMPIDRECYTKDLDKKIDQLKQDILNRIEIYERSGWKGAVS